MELALHKVYQPRVNGTTSQLAHKLGQTPYNVVMAQILYRLGLDEQLKEKNEGHVGAFGFDRVSAMTEQLEAARQ